jgi:peptidoglycan/xylan/chitin deacetylase (PgdA/CDA1 family)
MIWLVPFILICACAAPAPLVAVHTYVAEEENSPAAEEIANETAPVFVSNFPVHDVIEEDERNAAGKNPTDDDDMTVTTVTAQDSRLDPAKPMIALTFDDGPGMYTDSILNILEQYNARATFCVQGKHIKGKNETLLRAVALGCEIIGHSWEHERFTELECEEIQRQILDVHSLIESIAGVMPAIYRPPFGEIDERVRLASEEVGFALLKWSVDPKDWQDRDADLIYDRILADVKNGSVVISHDVYETTAMAMVQLIPELIATGYQLVTVSELLGVFEGEIKPGVVYHGVK